MMPSQKLAIYRQGLHERLSRQPTSTELAELDVACQEAKIVAQQLVEDYGARCVWLVGSVARGRPLRPDSDIDLVVEGMPVDLYYQLTGDLYTSSGRAVDLIRLESARPVTKQVIFLEGILLMSTTENLRNLALAIEAELEHLQQLANDIDETMDRFSPTEQATKHDMRAIALLLTEIYLGAENLMLRIAKSLDEPIPGGKAWHAELLEQFSTELPSIRPALFRPATVEQLDEFRRFRHVVHHVYTFDYDWSQIKKLLTMAPSLLQHLTSDAQQFRAFLIDSLADRDET